MSSSSTVVDRTADRRLRQAETLHHRAVQENAGGHAARGAQLINRALTILAAGLDQHDPRHCSPERCRMTSRLLATLAKSEVEIRGVQPALEVMDRSLAWSGCLADPELSAFLISQRALILFRGGQLAAAQSDFDQAISLMPGTGVDLVRVLLNRGALHVERGAVPSARADLTRAHALSQRLGFRPGERISLHNLGCLEFTAGDLPRALQLMQEGMEMDGDMQQGIAHLDRSRVLLAAGLPAEADDALDEAATLFRRDRCWQDLAEVDLTRAEVALLTDRVADARRLAGRARDRFRRHGNERWRRSAELVLLQADQAAGRPPARLLPPARRLVDEFEEADLATASRTARLVAAELALALGRSTEAEVQLSAVGRERPSDPIGLRLHRHLVRADSLERRGDLPAAGRILRHGLTELAAYQAQFGGVDLKSASAVHGRRLATRDLGLALRSGRAGSVMAAVERSRAVSGRIRSVIPPADPRAAELLAEVRRALEAPDPDRRRVAELQAELRSRSWLDSGSRHVHPPAASAALRAAAEEDGHHLVTICQSGGRLLAATFPPSRRPKLVELVEAAPVHRAQRRMAADLDLLANADLPTALRTAATQALRRGTGTLGRLLAAALPTDDRPVVISPPSELLSLPWPLLPQLQGRPVVVTPSLSGWHRARARLAESRASLVRPWSVTAAAGPGLERARQETADVVGSWSTRAATRDRAAATSAELLTAMAESRLVHVAAHGVHQAVNPMFSSLALSGGPLFAYELDRQGRVPEHVVLSACDVGRSTVRAGEETIGMTSVLLQLGSACVVAGVSRVHDDVAADLMRRYHRELVAGRSAAQALSLVAGQVDAPSPFVCFGGSWAAGAAS